MWETWLLSREAPGWEVEDTQSPAGGTAGAWLLPPGYVSTSDLGCVSSYCTWRWENPNLTVFGWAVRSNGNFSLVIRCRAPGPLANGCWAELSCKTIFHVFEDCFNAYILHAFVTDSVDSMWSSPAIAREVGSEPFPEPRISLIFNTLLGLPDLRCIRLHHVPSTRALRGDQN